MSEPTKFQRFLAGMSGADLSAEEPAVVVVEQPAPKAEQPAPSADALASAKADGIKAEQVRWATVLGHENATGRMNAAVTLLAEPSLIPAERICAMLPNMGKDTVTASEQPKVEPQAPKPDPIAAVTPKVDVGAHNNDGSPKAEEPDGKSFWGSVTAEAKVAEGGKPKFAMRG